MFAITNATEFFSKVREDLAALEERIDDSGRAMNCILSTYHLHEWVWAYLLKPTTPRKLGNVMIHDKSSFVAFLETSCPHFTLLQQLTNGTKHCALVHPTAKIEGYGIGPGRVRNVVGIIIGLISDKLIIAYYAARSNC